MRAAARVGAALVLPLAVISGCSAGGNEPRAGADLEKVGPQVVPGQQPVAPPASAGASKPVPMAGSSASASSRVPADVRELQNALTGALGVEDPAAAGSMTLEQRRFAENQLVVTWTVSKDPDDAAAKIRVRRQAIAILVEVRRHPTTYGAVLLIANAAVRDTSGRKVDAKVVHAKYSHALIQRTDFATVSVDTIFKLPDDKPAEIHPAFR